MRREEKSNPAAAARQLDLRGVPCPLSWARAKVELEGLRRGTALTILLDDPRGARDLPRAAEAEGYAVEAVVEEGGVWRICLQV